MNDVDVVNMALGMMGDDFITALDPPDDSDRARLAKTLYEPLLKVCMGETPWNFALKRVALSADAAAPVWGYTYQYTLPTDCLRVRRLDDKSVEFKVLQGKIHTHQAGPLNIEYIAYIEDPTAWDAHFTESFAYKLAARMATLMGSTEKGKHFDELYREALRDAIADDTKEGWPEDFQSHVLTDVRIG